MSKKVKNLYLIGNGFDIHHDIRCKYSDFHKWLCVNNPMLENRLFQVYGLHHNDFWSSFETNIGEITTEAILEGYVYAPMMMFIHSINEEEPVVLNMDDYTEQVGEIGYTLERLYNDLQLAFSNWILQLENANPVRKVRIDKNKSAFINFNYTQTLENLYAILSSNILYIHGCAVKNDKLIFGHNKTPDKLLENWQDNYSQEELSALVEASNELSVLYKDVKSIIENNCTFWESIKYVNKIHVWGLSLSDVDMPYISHIHSILNNDGIEWEFSWFAEPDKNRIMEIVNRLQIKDYKLIKLVDIMY